MPPMAGAHNRIDNYLDVRQTKVGHHAYFVTWHSFSLNCAGGVGTKYEFENIFLTGVEFTAF